MQASSLEGRRYICLPLNFDLPGKGVYDIILVPQPDHPGDVGIQQIFTREIVCLRFDVLPRYDEVSQLYFIDNHHEKEAGIKSMKVPTEAPFKVHHLFKTMSVEGASISGSST